MPHLQHCIICTLNLKKHLQESLWCEVHCLLTLVLSMLLGSPHSHSWPVYLGSPTAAVSNSICFQFKLYIQPYFLCCTFFFVGQLFQLPTVVKCHVGLSLGDQEATQPHSAICAWTDMVTQHLAPTDFQSDGWSLIIMHLLHIDLWMKKLAAKFLLSAITRLKIQYFGNWNVNRVEKLLLLNGTLKTEIHADWNYAKQEQLILSAGSC